MRLLDGHSGTSVSHVASGALGPGRQPEDWIRGSVRRIPLQYQVVGYGFVLIVLMVSVPLLIERC